MVTDARAARSGGPDGGSDELWRRLWSHRDALLKVARRRSMSPEDAEDAVHEAMLRAAEHPDVEDERLGAWLTTVTMRLCVDRYRQVNREAQVRSRSALAAPGPVPVEDSVCDRAEATWLAHQSRELPARQAEALRLKSEDLDVAQVASTMGLSYQAVESLLARARRTLRDSLAGTLGLGVWLCRPLRSRAGASGGPMVAVVSTAATLAVVGIAVPHAFEAHAPRPPAHSSRPTTSAARPAVRVRGGSAAAPGGTAVRVSDRPGPARAAGASARGTAPLLPALPSLPIPSAAVAPAPALPAVPSPAAVPSAAFPPSVPSLPATPPVRSASLPRATALPTKPPRPLR